MAWILYIYIPVGLSGFALGWEKACAQLGNSQKKKTAEMKRVASFDKALIAPKFKSCFIPSNKQLRHNVFWLEQVSDKNNTLVLLEA